MSAPAPPKPVQAPVTGGGGLLGTLPAADFQTVAYDETADDYQYKGKAVDFSPCLKRIMALPRRTFNPSDPKAAKVWTQHLRKNRTTPCDCNARWGDKYPEDHPLAGQLIPGTGCITELSPIQGLALDEAYDVGGALGIIGVGAGKTGLGIQLAWALFPHKAKTPAEAKVVLLLIPPKLKRRFFTKDYHQWAAHFEVPNLAGMSGASFIPDGRPVLHVLTYSELSVKRNTDILSRLRPDGIIADECQNLSNPTTTRGGRFFHVFTQTAIERSGKPKPKYVPMSGTMTNDSIKEYAHHAKHALGYGSPLPVHEPTVDEWAAALDVSDQPAPMGRLRMLCEPGETVEEGFARRLFDTKGVVTTDSSSFAGGLEITAIEAPPMPEDVIQHLHTIRATDERPDGEESDGAMMTSNWLREMASGFYSYWAFPKEYKAHCKCPAGADCLPTCAARALIDRWMAARKDYNKAVRLRLKHRREFMDSPDLLKDAAKRWFDGYEHKGVTYPPRTVARIQHERCLKCRKDLIAPQFECSCGWVAKGGPLATWDSKLGEDDPVKGPAPETWPAWRDVEDLVQPEPRTRWVSHFLVNACIEWGKKNRGLIWCAHKDFGRLVAKGLGVPYYDGGGKDPELDEKGDRTVVLSIKANNAGLNLQKMFYRNLFVHPMNQGKIWEQALGRTHRPGQPRPTVEVDVFLHTPENTASFTMARRSAKYIQVTNRTPQKLCLATIDLTKAAVDPDSDER